MARLTVLCALMLAAPQPQPAAAPAPGPARHALLVGCTRYPHLPAEHQLAGPGNDVALIRDLLRECFNFPDANIARLVDNAGNTGTDANTGNDGNEGQRPLRTNIEREFKRLAEVVRAGDQVVIFMAGHGSQQPDQEPPDPADVEPDGLDEIFCPADIAEATEDAPDRVPNAITDDEIRVWLERILDRGAAVCLLVDACHSGTMGRNLERGREIPASLLVKADRLQKARERAPPVAESARGGSLVPHHPETPHSERGSFVALYASQADERTVEKRFPPDSAAGQSYGLLTYTLTQVLRQSRTPLTYRELVARIHGRYVQMGRTSPTPMLEGNAMDREVLGSPSQPGRSSSRSRIVLQRGADGTYAINAGTLQDVTLGTVLAVFPPEGDVQADQPAGHMRVTQADLLSARVEPCSWGDAPAPAMLPAGGRCEVVNPDYGVRKLRVALDPLAEGGTEVDPLDRQRVQVELQTLAGRRISQWGLVEDARQADWMIRLQPGARPCHVVLVPADTGVTSGARGEIGGARGVKDEASKFGPVPLDRQLGPWLEQRLDQVAQATRLLRLAEAAQTERAVAGSTGKVEFLKFQGEHDQQGQAVVWGASGLDVSVGDLVAFRVRNSGRSRLDVALVFIDSNYDIELFFPEAGQNGDSRIPPGATLKTPLARVSSGTLGLEHMLVILTQAKPEQAPLDFSFLAQSPLERARGGRSQPPVSRSALEQLLDSASDGSAARRGAEKQLPADYEIRVFSWRARSR